MFRVKAVKGVKETELTIGGAYEWDTVEKAEAARDAYQAMYPKANLVVFEVEAP